MINYPPKEHSDEKAHRRLLADSIHWILQWFNGLSGSTNGSFLGSDGSGGLEFKDVDWDAVANGSGTKPEDNATLTEIGNMVLNGRANRGSNLNWSAAEYRANEGVSGGPCFYKNAPTPTSASSDELIPVNENEHYMLAASARVAPAGMRVYLGVICIGENGVIEHWECWRNPNKNTTLYEAVTQGATTIKIVPASEDWFVVASPFSYIQWDIAADFSDLPQQTAVKINNIDKSTEGSGYWTLTLAAGAPANYPIGTPVGNSTSGATQTYALNLNPINTTDWVHFESILTPCADKTRAPLGTEIRAGTRYVRFLWWPGYNVGGEAWLDSVAMVPVASWQAQPWTDGTSLSDAINNTYGIENGATQNAFYRQATEPASPINDKTYWTDTSVTPNELKFYTGSAWVTVSTLGADYNGNVTNTPTQLGDINPTEGNKLSGIDDSATKNDFYRQATAPTSPVNDKTYWTDTSVTPNELKFYTGSSWVTISTLGADYSSNVTNKPTALSDINGTEGTKLSGIETGATVGATAGTNLRDAASNLIGDADVLNSYNVLDSAITVTVGTGGDYATINAALAGLTQKFPTYASTAARATINILTGTQITEQVIVDGIDLSWITITSVDASVTENITSYTGVSNANGLLFYPIIAAINGGKAPVLKLKISTALASGRYGGLFVFGAGSSAEFAHGSAYGFDCTMVSPSTTNFGIYCETLGRVSGVLTSITNFGFNIYVTRGAEVQIESGNFDGAHFPGIFASDGGRFTGRGGSVDNSQYSLGAVVAVDGAHIDVYGMTVDNPTGDAFHCVGSMIQARGCTATNIPAGKYAFNVLGGGIITASSSTASLSQTANTITSSGLIIQ